MQLNLLSQLLAMKRLIPIKWLFSLNFNLLHRRKGHVPLSPKSLGFVGECRMNGVHVDHDRLQDGVQDSRSLRGADLNNKWLP